MSQALEPPMRIVGSEAELNGRLVHLVEFKWLMIGMGWRVDISRFERDPSYASVCIERGLRAVPPSLRERMRKLLPFLGSPTPGVISWHCREAVAGRKK